MNARAIRHARLVGYPQPYRTAPHPPADSARIDVCAGRIENSEAGSRPVAMRQFPEGVTVEELRFAHTMVAKAKVQAFKAPVVDWPIGFRGGPVLTEDALQRFRHCRAGKPFDHFDSEADYPERLEGDFVYAGPLYPHFGHFLSEMVHRILPSRASGLPERYLFVLPEGAVDGLTLAGLPTPIRDVLTFLGVTDDNARVINRNTVVERLHITQQGAQLNHDPLHAYLQLLRMYSEKKLDSIFGETSRPQKLYVSRSGLPKPGGILGERHLDGALTREGFTVFRPEHHDFTTQMDHYRKAETLVFAEGSACHGTELLGQGMLKTCVLIPRSQQSPLFVQLLKPRANRFIEAGGTRYIGTAELDPASGQPLFHRGVSVLVPRCLKEALAEQQIATLSGFSEARYAFLKAADLFSYVREVKANGGKVDWRTQTMLWRAAMTAR